MSMYKNIYVNEEWEGSEANASVLSVNGEVQLFGDTAFASVAAALEAAGSNGNAVIIKVASGKYDVYRVVNEGVITSPDKVVAVDFNGGEIETADGKVSVAASEFSVEAQADIIAELNAKNSGILYVASDSIISIDSTVYVGVGVDGYVAGVRDAVVSGSNKDEVITIIDKSNISVSVPSSSDITVDASFNSATAGWDETAFDKLEGALNKAEDGDVININSDLANDFVDKSIDIANKNLTFAGKSEIAMGTELELQIGRGGNASVTIAEGAEITLAQNINVSGARPDDYNGSTGNQRGEGVLNVDGTLNVDYIIDRGIVNVNKGGVLISDEIRVANHLGVEKAAELNVKDATLDVNTMLVGNDGTGEDGNAKFTVSGISTVKVDSLSNGNKAAYMYIDGNTTLINSSVGGSITFGYGPNKQESGTLTIAGDSFKAKALYVGDKTIADYYVNGEKHELLIDDVADVKIGSLYVRPTAEATVTDSGLTIGDLYVRGSMVVDNSTLDRKNADGGTGHWVVYEDDDASKTAELLLTDSAITNGNYLVVGSMSNGYNPANSNALLIADNSDITFSKMYLQGAENFQNNSVTLKNGSKLSVSELFVGQYATLNVTDSEIAVKSFTNNGTVTAIGDNTLKADNINSTTILQFGSTAEDRNSIELGSYSGNAATTITGPRVRIDNTDLTLQNDVTVSLKGNLKDGSYSMLRVENTNVDLNDKTLKINGMAIFGGKTGGVVLENGTVDIYAYDGEAGHNNVVFQSSASTIESDATFNVLNGSAISFYEDLTVKGKFYDKRDSGNPIIIGHGSAGDFTNGTQLTITGSGAEFVSDKMGMTVYGKNEESNIKESSLVVENGAKFVLGGSLTNKGIITVDANSSFSAVSINNTGKFNSDNAGEMVVLGNMNVTGNIKTTDLVLKSGSVLSAASITVTNLTLAIGSALTLTGSGSSIAAEYITVTGDLGTAEYSLVLKGWNFDKYIYFDVNQDGVIAANEVFTIGVENNGILFDTVNSENSTDLIVKKVTVTDPTEIYIGADVDPNAAPGTKITVNGVTYTVGVDAFSSITDAAGSGNVKKENVAEIVLNEGDHIDEIVAAGFNNISKITILEEKRVVDVDDTVSSFSGNLEIDNAGHLDTHIEAAGDLEIKNTSVNTLLGAYSGASVSINNTGAVGDTAEDQTVISATSATGDVTIDNLGTVENTKLTSNAGVVLSGNGSWDNVDVVSDALYLDSIDFTLDADSTVNSVYMGQENAGTLTVDGATVDQILGGDLDASGTVDFKNASAVSGLQFTTIEDVDKVILSGGSHEFGGKGTFREYYMNTLEIGSADLTWNWTDNDSLLYNIGTPRNDDNGMIKVTNTAADATLNFNQNGEYSLGNFDVSAFDGIANISAGSTLTLEENTDYFADGATLNVAGGLNLEQAGKVTGIDFNGNGYINVNASHTFSAEAALDGFTGNLNITNADTTLTLDKANTTKAIINGAGDIDAKGDLTLELDAALNNFTGDVKANGADVDVNLNGANETNATFSGNGTVNANANQTLKADGALNDLEGTLNNNGKEIVLDGENTIQATVTGSGSIFANADQSFTGDVSTYTGSYTNAASKVTFTVDSTLAAEMTINGAGKYIFESQDASVTINSDDAKTDLTIGDNNITVNSGAFGEINGDNGSELIINSNTSADFISVDALVINAGMSLTAGVVIADSTYVYIADSDWQGPAIKIDASSQLASDFGDIMVDSWSSEFKTPFTIVDGNDGQVYNDTVIFLVNSGKPGTGIGVDGKAELIDGKYVRVYTKDGDLLIGNYNATSSVVYVNSDWNEIAGTVYKWQGIDGTVDRIIDVDASKTLVNAVNILAANSLKEGTIYVVKGDSYKTPDALMTGSNQVQKLTVSGNAVDPDQAPIDLGDVIFEGGIVALDGARSGELTLHNISVSGNIYGGAEISADSGSNTDTTKLTLDGGYYLSAQVAGGSYVTGGAYTVGSSEMVIKNTTGGEMAILGRVLGGSVASGNGNVVQDSASVLVDLSAGNQEITIRGDIYAAGSGNVSVNNSSVTFTGNADLLTFTGRVSGQAFGNEQAAAESELVFSNFDGMFKGLIQGFDTITVSGDSALEFSRKQTLTGETGFVFDLNGKTSADAMFTVNNFGWTYGTTITVNADFNTLASGSYVLVDNWSDYEGFTFKVNQETLTIGQTGTNGDYKLVLNGDELKLVFTDSSDIKDAATDADASSAAEKIVANGNTSSTTHITANKVDIQSGTVGTISGKFAGDVEINTARGVTTGKITGSSISNDNGDVTMNINSVNAWVTAVSGAGATAGNVDVTISDSASASVFFLNASDGGKIKGDSKITVKDSGIDGDSLNASDNGELLVAGHYGSSDGTVMVEGDTSIVIGEVGSAGPTINAKNGNIVAGGGKIGGNSSVIINSGEITGNEMAIIGGTSWGGAAYGNSGVEVQGNSGVTINGGKVTITSTAPKRAIYGGSYMNANTKGEAYVEINGGEISANIVAGGRENSVSGSTRFEMTGGKLVAGQVSMAGVETSAIVTGDAKAIISGGTINESVIIDGNMDQVGGVSSLTISGGTVNAAITGFDTISGSDNAESLHLTGINGDVNLGAGDDTITIDVDAVLNGTINMGDGNDTLIVKGLDANELGSFGAVGIVSNDISSIENFKIDAVDMTLNAASKINVGVDGVADTADDIWAKLGAADNGDLVVAWGTGADEASALADIDVAMNYYNNNISVLGSAVIADTDGLTAIEVDYENFKNNKGTLA